MVYILAIVGLVVAIVIYRFYKARQEMEWSRGKGIVAFGPAPLGHHFVFIDENLNVAVFLPKSDGTLHVMTGTPTGAEHWEKYNSAGEKVQAGKISDAPDWKIKKDEVQYRGGFLPKQGPPHKAEIQDVDEFKSSIDSTFTEMKAKKLIDHMNKRGELPMKAT